MSRNISYKLTRKPEHIYLNIIFNINGYLNIAMLSPPQDNAKIETKRKEKRKIWRNCGI